MKTIHFRHIISLGKIVRMSAKPSNLPFMRKMHILFLTTLMYRFEIYVDCTILETFNRIFVLKKKHLHFCSLYWVSTTYSLFDIQCHLTFNTLPECSYILTSGPRAQPLAVHAWTRKECKLQGAKPEVWQLSAEELWINTPSRYNP